MPFSQHSNTSTVILAILRHERPPTEPEMSPSGELYAWLWTVAESCWDPSPDSRPNGRQVVGYLTPHAGVPYLTHQQRQRISITTSSPDPLEPFFRTVQERNLVRSVFRRVVPTTASSHSYTSLPPDSALLSNIHKTHDGSPIVLKPDPKHPSPRHPVILSNNIDQRPFNIATVIACRDRSLAAIIARCSQHASSLPPLQEWARKSSGGGRDVEPGRQPAHPGFQVPGRCSGQCRGMLWRCDSRCMRQYCSY